MPLDITLGATALPGRPHSDPECPMRDVSHPIEGSDLAFVYGANDLWDAVHAHPDFHDLILGPEDRENRIGDLLDIIAAQTHVICGACKDNVIKDLIITLALNGEVMTAEKRHNRDHGDEDTDSEHTIVSVISAPEDMWMEDFEHDFPDATPNGYGFLTVHHRVAFYALMDDGEDRWVEPRGLRGMPLKSDGASGPCDKATSGQWECTGHFRPAPKPKALD